MPKGKVVKIHKVMPFSPPGAENSYISRMLIDAENSGSQDMQLNHGILKGGCFTPGAVHEGHDEIYIVLSGSAKLNLDNVEYDIEKGSVVFIPGGAFHALVNKSQTEDFEIITVWAGTPRPGANEVYDLRKKAWGTTYREIDRK